MTDQEIERILQSSSEPEAIFQELLPQLGKELNCDRVFLYCATMINSGAFYNTGI